MTSVVMMEIMDEQQHYPVMYREVLTALEVASLRVVVDCTVGAGSHATKIISALGPHGHFIGIDKDAESLEKAKEKLRPHEGRFTLMREDFSHLDEVLKKLKIEKADAFLFDLGISTLQLVDPVRGFSFLKEGPLDMRIDRSSYLCASDLINSLSEEELTHIFYKFGEERFSRRIAHDIVTIRKSEPIATTSQLSQIVARAVPSKYLHQRIHPATRVFQALRIAVNRELEVLQVGIEKAVSALSTGGKIAVISFHSLEDRIVKHTFKEFAEQGVLEILTKKPLIPEQDEIDQNNASRSAKLRVAQRI